VDAIAGKRCGGGNGQRLLSQLLTEVDGISTSNSMATIHNNDKLPKRVLVLAATNRPDLIDSALLRPGRIDRMIYVGLPDYESRKQILEIGLKNKPCHDDVQVDKLAKDDLTFGFSGAELVAICREAALYAIEEDHYNNSTEEPLIHSKHLLKSIQGMKRQITPQMLEFYENFRNQKL